MRMSIAAEEYKISFKSPVVTPTPLSLTLTASGVSKRLYTEPCWNGLLSLWGCQELEKQDRSDGSLDHCSKLRISQTCRRQTMSLHRRAVGMGFFW